MLKKWAAVLFISIGLLTISSKTYADETSPLSLVKTYESDWNKHDVKDLAQIFTQNISFITVTGVYLKNRDAFFKAHARLHHGNYKNSVITLDNYSIKFIKPDVALVHWTWTMTGVLNSDGTAKPAYKGIFTWVAVKQNNTWQVLSSQNTISS
jgi:uncharacterized protein (TIGR02246 family)